MKYSLDFKRSEMKKLGIILIVFLLSRCLVAGVENYWGVDLKNAVNIYDSQIDTNTDWESDKQYIIWNIPLEITNGATLKIPAGTEIYYLNNYDDYYPVFEVLNNGCLITDSVSPNNIEKQNIPIKILPLDFSGITGVDQNLCTVSLHKSASPDCNIQNIICFDNYTGIISNRELIAPIRDNIILYCYTGINSTGTARILNNCICYWGESVPALYFLPGFAIRCHPYTLKDFETDIITEMSDVTYYISGNTLYHGDIGVYAEKHQLCNPTPINVYIYSNIFSKTWDFTTCIEHSVIDHGLRFNGFNKIYNYWSNRDIEIYPYLYSATDPFVDMTLDNLIPVILKDDSVFNECFAYNDILSYAVSERLPLNDTFHLSPKEDEVPAKQITPGFQTYSNFTGSIRYPESDFNLDGIVSLDDYIKLSKYYLEEIPYYEYLDKDIEENYNGEPNYYGDINNDFIVNLNDFAIIAKNWGEHTTDPNYDLNQNGTVEINDVSTILKNHLHKVSTIKTPKEDADPNVISIDLNKDFIIDHNDIAELTYNWLDNDVSEQYDEVPMTIVSTDTGEVFDINDISGKISFKFEHVSFYSQTHVYLGHEKIGRVFYGDELLDWDLRTFSLNTNIYRNGTYLLTFVNITSDHTKSIYNKIITINNEIEDLVLPNITKDMDKVKFSYRTKTPSSQFQILDRYSEEIAYTQEINTNYADIIIDDPNIIPACYTIRITPNVQTKTSQSPINFMGSVKPSEKVPMDSKMLILVPFDDIEKCARSIITEVINACRARNVSYTILYGKDANYGSLRKHVTEGKAEYLVIFTHANFIKEKNISFLKLYARDADTYKLEETRMYSYDSPLISNEEAKVSAFLSDLVFYQDGQLKLVYNFGCNTGVAIQQSRNIHHLNNDFAYYFGTRVSDGTDRVYCGFADAVELPQMDFFDSLTKTKTGHINLWNRLGQGLKFKFSYIDGVISSGGAGRVAFWGGDGVIDGTLDYSEIDPVNRDKFTVYGDGTLLKLQ